MRCSVGHTAVFYRHGDTPVSTASEEVVQVQCATSLSGAEHQYGWEVR